MNIYEKMSAITQEISTVAKNLNVGLGKNQYKAVGEADVLAAVKPIEAKHKIYSYPFSREIVDSGEMVTTSNYNGNASEKRQMYLRIKTVYRFVDMEKPSDYIDITTFGDGIDSQDKAPGKAMTYADKYALLKAYKIQTGDDPDQNVSEPLGGVQRQDAPPDRTGQPAYPPTAQIVQDVEEYIARYPNVAPFVKTQCTQAGVNNLKELADVKPAFVQALWNKWCNKQ